MCSIVTRAGQNFSGILAGTESRDGDLVFLFKMVKEIPAGLANGADGTSDGASTSEYIGAGEDYEMIFSLSSLATISVVQASVPGRNNTGGKVSLEFSTGKLFSHLAS
jgi:hypothetical protein